MILVVSMVLVFAPAAGATDGVLEINKACVSVGCFSGDDPDWPVEIDGSAGRSYRLASDLVLPGVDKSGIEVAANNVDIDLNGFAIIRDGCQESCDRQSYGGSYGVAVKENSVSGLSVKNGSVVGMGGPGVRVGANGKVANVRARWNGDGGIFGWEDCTISNNLVYENDSSGIHARLRSKIVGNVVRGNEFYGLSLVGAGVDAPGYTLNVISDSSLGAVTGGVDLGMNLCHGSLTCP